VHAPAGGHEIEDEVAEGTAVLEIVEVPAPGLLVGDEAPELVRALADELLRLDARELAEARRDLGGAQIGAPLPLPVGGGLGNVAEALFAAPQRLDRQLLALLVRQQ